MRIVKNQLKIDLASTKPLAKAYELEESRDGFEGAMIIEGIAMVPEILIYQKEDGSIVRELRSAEEIKLCLERGTAHGKPYTNDHPPDMLNAEDATRHAKGSILDKGRWVEEDESARYKVMALDKRTIDDFRDGKRCWSVGVYSDDIHEPGVWRGQEYDVRQTNLRLNHLAQVDRGRHARAAGRMDSADEETHMSTRNVVLGGQAFALDSTAADAVLALKSKMDEMQAEMDEMAEQMDEEEVKTDSPEMMEKLAEVISMLKAMAEMMGSYASKGMDGEDEVMDEEEPMDEGMYGDKMDAAVGARVQLVAELSACGLEGFDLAAASKMDADTLRREIIVARAPGLKDAVANAEGAELRGMYNVARSMAVQTRTKSDNDDLAKTLAPKRDGFTSAFGEARKPQSATQSAHDAYLEALKG